MRSLTSVATGLLSASLVVAAANAEERRELGAHEHGHGKLNIAIEGSTVAMELEAPGADLVGFEHEAKTEQQKAAVEKAKALLSDPQQLFKLPAAAVCKVKEAKVAVEHEHEDDVGKAHEHDAKHDKKEHAGNDEAEHSEFHVNYTLECAKPAALTSIQFDYFKVFAGAEELDVSIVSEKSQKTYEVTRDKPVIDLAGIM